MDGQTIHRVFHKGQNFEPENPVDRISQILVNMHKYELKLTYQKTVVFQTLGHNSSFLGWVLTTPNNTFLPIHFQAFPQAN